MDCEGLEQVRGFFRIVLIGVALYGVFGFIGFVQELLDLGRDAQGRPSRTPTRSPTAAPKDAA